MVDHQDMPEQASGPQMVTNVRLTGAQTTTREESDIRINTDNLSQIICASTQLGGTQPMSYSTDGGATWSQAGLPEFTGDARQGDPTIDWTSDGTAWTVTIGIIATTDLVMRTFKSTDQGATWTFDSTVTTTQSNMDKQALWIDHSRHVTAYRQHVLDLAQQGSVLCVGQERARGRLVRAAADQRLGDDRDGDRQRHQDQREGDVFAFWPDTAARTYSSRSRLTAGRTSPRPSASPRPTARSRTSSQRRTTAACLIYLSGGAFVRQRDELRLRGLERSRRRSRLQRLGQRAGKQRRFELQDPRVLLTLDGWWLDLVDSSKAQRPEREERSVLRPSCRSIKSPAPHGRDLLRHSQ